MDNQKSSEPKQSNPTKKWRKCPKRLSVMFSLLTFLTLTLTILFSALLTLLLIRTGILVRQNRGIVFFVIALVSILVGTIISNYAGRHPLTAIIAMSNATQEVARGNFDVSLDENIRIKELREMAHNFNLMAKELAGTEILRTDFVENVSHEFKTPITSLGGFADLLLEDEEMPLEERREYLQIISSEARRLAALSSQILALSRVEAQTILTDTVSFDLTEQLRQAAIMIERKWAKKSIQVHLNVDECIYIGNESLLKEVWMNLLDNAAKFSPKGGVVEVCLRRLSAETVVTVRDSGPGMSKTTQEHIFDQFYQGDTSHRTEGNGIGLALVHKTLELHKAKVTVDSSPGHGSTFTVILANQI